MSSDSTHHFVWTPPNYFVDHGEDYSRRLQPRSLCCRYSQALSIRGTSCCLGASRGTRVRRWTSGRVHDHCLGWAHQSTGTVQEICRRPQRSPQNFREAAGWVWISPLVRAAGTSVPLTDERRPRRCLHRNSVVNERCPGRPEPPEVVSSPSTLTWKMLPRSANAQKSSDGRSDQWDRLASVMSSSWVLNS